MISRLPSQCHFCRHFRSPVGQHRAAGPDGEAPAPTCDAFEDGIPDDVWWNRADHREPFPGDHGVRWEPDEDAEFTEYAFDPNIIDQGG